VRGDLGWIQCGQLRNRALKAPLETTQWVTSEGEALGSKLLIGLNQS
jgi:hypothetical protein